MSRTSRVGRGDDARPTPDGRSARRTRTAPRRGRRRACTRPACRRRRCRRRRAPRPSGSPAAMRRWHGDNRRDADQARAGRSGGAAGSGWRPSCLSGCGAAPDAMTSDELHDVGQRLDGRPVAVQQLERLAIVGADTDLQPDGARVAGRRPRGTPRARRPRRRARRAPRPARRRRRRCRPRTPGASSGRRRTRAAARRRRR